MTSVNEYDYELPEALVAATPAERRDRSRLLVLERESGALSHARFFELPRWLREGDVLVVNDARVMPVRLRARRRTGGRVEVLLVSPQTPAGDELTWPEDGGAALTRVMPR